MKKIVFLLISLSSFAFAEYTAYAWGYGDIMRETLQVVKYIFSIDEFKDVWRIAVLVSMVAGLFMMMTPNPDLMRLPKIMIISMGVYTIFATAKTDVWVEDKADPAKSGLVTQVPWAVGYPLAFFSTMEYRMGVMYETATSMPEDVKYSNSGFLAPVSIFALASEHRIVTPSLYQNVQNYIIECVVPDIESGWKDYQTLINSDNAWAYIGNTSPSIFLLQMEEDNTQTLTTCPTAYTNITAKLSQYVSSSGKGMEHLGSSLGGLTGSAVYSKYGMASNFLLGTSKSASSLLLQNTTLNMVSESFQKYSMMNGADLGSASFHTAQASAAASAQMVISGLLGVKYIPLMKGILTVVVIGLTPLLMLLMVTPIGVKTLIGYILMLAWLACWHFGDAILNHIIMVKIQNALSIHGEIAFSTQGAINSTITDYINTASAMYWTIPTIALIVVSGFSLASLTSLNSSLTSKLDRTATTAGAGMGSGNINYGNVSHSNYGANKVMASSAVQTGQSFDYSNTSSLNEGVSAKRENSVSSQTGELGNKIQTDIANNSALNSVVNGIGMGANSQNITGTMETASDGTKILKGEGLVTFQGANGETYTGKYESGSIFGKDGNIQKGDVTVDHGDGASTTVTYANGQEKSRTYSGKDGEAEVRDNGDGTKFFSVKSQDGSTEARGIIKEDGSKQVDYAKVGGKTWERSQSTEESISEQESHKMAQILNEQIAENKEQRKGNDQNLTSDLAGKVGLGIGGGFIVKAEASAEMGVKNAITVTYGNGETKTHSLSEQEMQEFNKIQSMAKTEVQKENMASDQMKNYVEKQLNSGNETILQDVNNISRNKDNIGGLESTLDKTISKPDHDIKQKIDDTKSQLENDRNNAPNSIGEKGLNSLKETIKDGQISVKDFVDKNVPDAINSTYSGDGTKTNDRTGEVTSLTGYTGPEAMNKNKPIVDGQIPNETENIIKALGNNNPKTSNNQQNQIEIPKK
ncbi:MAG: conjugal transfer protein TraG N-terminal domain-containing protein [Aliarcobacter skirrowii]|uniref:conjugal transfer protein TraG N-terminal domain-containing protein n=1 Tax=Aliarcobacter skirrowii TaxID=28200 RepID=UPI00242F14E5|nr:conjugal transfer protein TraG N-terminal domain-containing protein [Aliarcobacter skirrowii]MDD2508659.1 conjugal transfer protein TraG N-terminal domain-containing protein [Aliarcobacter skirrowii]MDD3496871.1 conjugal transfer protein TraG N-terminal domain-containing protein [Aliarcobacter skirrowii]